MGKSHSQPSPKIQTSASKINADPDGLKVETEFPNWVIQKPAISMPIWAIRCFIL